jgi:hypothetical protein
VDFGTSHSRAASRRAAGTTICEAAFRGLPTRFPCALARTKPASHTFLGCRRINAFGGTDEGDAERLEFLEQRDRITTRFCSDPLADRQLFSPRNS